MLWECSRTCPIARSLTFPDVTESNAAILTVGRR